MTKVFFREYYDSYLFIVEGHSGYSVKGDDIVCAAVSVLCHTLLECLRDEESLKRLKLRREAVRDGYMCIEAEPFDFSRERTAAIVETCVSGLSILSDEYPDYVRLI